MKFWDYFSSSAKPATASIAKERLQIIVAHERSQRGQPDYLPRLQQELLEVIRRYVPVGDEDVQVQVDRNDHCSVLELNINLPQA